jgi:pimeloyl-ACP methyl ester carboxylesterase/DNA-binding CsgD family transcriptional regulator
MSHREQQQIRFCKSRDGTRIAYATCGSGPPMVWLGHYVRHLDLDWQSPIWRPWLSFLSRRHTLIRYDFRGCGLSDRDDVEFSLQRHVEDLEAVVEAAGLDRFVLFAMQGGGPKASLFVTHHRHRVTHLILYGVPTRGRMADRSKPQRIEEAETRLKAIEFGWRDNLPAYGHFFVSLQIPNGSPEQKRSFNMLLRETLSPKQAVALLRSYWKADVRTILPQIDCPTLVMHARGDPTIPFEEGRKVAALVPGARFVPLETGNHILLEGEPSWEQFTQAIEEFLPAGQSGTTDCLAELTPRERDLLEFVAQGSDNNEIAARLNISVKTVRNHLSTIFSKLGASTRAQVIVQARDAGFGRRR